jgi:hypothetical protein
MLAEPTAKELGQNLIDQLGEHGQYRFVMYIVDETGRVNQLSNMPAGDVYALLRRQVYNYEFGHEGAGHA